MTGVQTCALPIWINWFQLYTQAEPSRTREFVERAAAAGYRAIVLTVDLPLLGYRERDRRSGFDLVGPHCNFTDRANAATGAVAPTHGGGVHATADDGFAQLKKQVLTGLSWADLATIRSWSPLPLVLKGIMTAEDARLAVEHGADGIVVSNHGARQLDRVSATADVLRKSWTPSRAAPKYGSMAVSGAAWISRSRLPWERVACSLGDP